jgi:hypothetical protein
MSDRRESFGLHRRELRLGFFDQRLRTLASGHLSNTKGPKTFGAGEHVPSGFIKFSGTRFPEGGGKKVSECNRDFSPTMM